MKQIPASKLGGSRTHEPQEDPELDSDGVVPWDQGRLFAQMASLDDGAGGYVPSVPAPTAAQDRIMVEALAEQWVPRIQGATQWPMQAMLYLPQLGRISASVQKDPHALSVELQAEEVPTGRWLARVQHRYQNRLAEALGQAVDVHVRPVNAA